MNKKEIMEELDRLKVSYKSNDSKEDLQKLLETHQENVTSENEDESKSESLVDKFSKALVTKEEPPDVVDDTVSKLKSKSYGTLTRAQRLILRSNSEEYEDVDGGVPVKLNDRIKVEQYIIKLPDNSYRAILKGKTYKLSQNHYESLKNETRRVNTVETEHLCCGRAVKEDVPLLVEADA